MRANRLRSSMLLLCAATCVISSCTSKGESGKPDPGTDPPTTVERCKDAHVLGEANSLTIEVADLTRAQLGSTQEFLVPDDLVSVVVTLEAPNEIVTWERISIDAQVISRFTDLFGGSGLSRSMPLFPNVASLLYPNNEATSQLGNCLRVKAGVLGGGTEELRLSLMTLRRPERALGDHIDLQFRVLDDAVSAGEAAQIASKLEQLYYGACDGFDCLLPKVHDEPLFLESEDGTGVVEVDEMMNYNSSFAQLAMVVDDAVPRGLNVVFVNELLMSMLEDDMTLLGMAGGIPSTPFDGTPGSSLVISVDAHRDQSGALLAEFISATVAHEVGHMMGLFHTTEQDGKSFDPLEDTPRCDAKTFDADSNGRVDASECGSAGADNMMFWQASPSLDSHLTPAQAEVLRAHPLVYRK